MTTKKITVKKLEIANGSGLYEVPVYKLAQDPPIEIISDGVIMVTKFVMVAQPVVMFEGSLYAEVVDNAAH